EASGGTYNTFNFVAETSSLTSWGGYLLNASRRQSDGFKELDGGGFTGFYQDDYMGKLKFKLPSSKGLVHELDLKLGYSKEDSNETYLGLSEDDFYDNFKRRYRASANDEMRWEHFTGKLDHTFQVRETGILTTTLYRNNFDRSWYRLDRFQDNTKL